MGTKGLYGLSARLLLPGAGVVLLEIAQRMAGRLVGRPAPPRRRDRLLVATVEELDAHPVAVEPIAGGAVGQEQNLGAVRILVLDREPDRLLGGESVLGGSMRQKAAVVIGPEMGGQR